MKVALIMGGRSGEHEVSLRTGAEVARALDELGHERFELVLGKTGGARWPDGEGTVAQGLVALEAYAPDVAFIAMHGPDGEDGRVQGALELLGIRYHGSGVQASSNGLDKARTKELFRLAGLPIARDRVIDNDETPSWSAVAAELGLPLVLKTEASGSSVGVEVVRDVGTLAERGAALLASTPRLLVEAYLPGREFTGPVLEDQDGTPRALPIIEIKPKTAAFFDYEAKYTDGATDEICPAAIPAALEARLRDLAVRSHQALRCGGYSRTDLKLDAHGEPFVLEVNTLPGLTRESLFPRAAKVVGMSFADLVQRLLDRAMSAS
ncbi:MAG: D-alanine--D-alanine ligase [Deltaproteobacteria bacterium]|nr:D-alanine--D-alanine ligase [Deltaproteobacteria bacterium]